MGEKNMMSKARLGMFLFILSFGIGISLCPAQIRAISPSKVKKELAKIEKKYPDRKLSSKMKGYVYYFDNEMKAEIRIPKKGCSGFVAYVTKKIFGQPFAGEHSSEEEYRFVGAASTKNEKKMKKLFKKAKAGDVVWWNSEDGTRHMAIYMSRSNKGIRVYENNFTGRVRYNHLWEWKNMSTWPKGGAKWVSVVRAANYKKA